MRDADEIENEAEEANADAFEGRDRFPGMTYAEGVSAALRWVLGETDEPPYTGEGA